jgi:uncharacterized protein
MKSSFLSFRLLLLAGCLAVAGCDGIIPPPQADPTRYYVLSGQGLPDGSGPSLEANAPAGKTRLGIRNVELAAYLKTPSIIVRNGSNELLIGDFQRWAEPLGDGIARVVRTRLLADRAVASVALQPFSFGAPRDYDIAITVTRCEGNTAGDRSFASFAAGFEIRTSGPDSHVVARKVFVAPETPWNGRDFGQLAGLLSDDADALGREVITSLPSSP